MSNVANTDAPYHTTPKPNTLPGVAATVMQHIEFVAQLTNRADCRELLQQCPDRGLRLLPSVAYLGHVTRMDESCCTNK